MSWPKALHEVDVSDGVVEKVTEQEIADAKAVIGRCGIGCEPASAATLAGIRKLTAAGVMRARLGCGRGAYRKCPKRSWLYSSSTTQEYCKPEWWH